MADSFNKKEREKKRQKRKKEKAFKREQKKAGTDKPIEFMYVDEDGNLTPEPPDITKKRAVTNVEDIEISTRKQEKSSESKFTKTGIVKFFNSEKGYGFIDTSENSESFFVHADNLNQEVREGDHVSFEIGKGPKGPIATDVSLVEK
jgi:cold shock CspA family protein